MKTYIWILCYVIQYNNIFLYYINRIDISIMSSSSTSIFPIDIKIDNSNNNNTYPSATYNYDVTNCYFQGFLTDSSSNNNNNNLIGLEFSYYSSSPSITMKQNETLKNVDMYYTSRFAIVPIIHDIFSNDTIYANDLELIIEHRPDLNNTSQVNLYTCFIFTTNNCGSRYKAGAFDTLFESIDIKNLKAATLNKKNNENINQAKIDNLKQPNLHLSFNATMLNHMTDDIVQSKDAYYYLDKKSNIFIVFNHPICISNNNYDILAYPSSTNNSLFTRPIENYLTKIFSDTDFRIKEAVYDLSFQYQFANTKTQGFTTLKENFATLREGLIGNYVYCRPADSSNGSNLVTTTINEYANNAESQSSILLNDLTMIFVIMIVFIFMCLFAPVWFMFSGENILGFHTGVFLWVLRAILFILFFAGGVALIIVSRTSHGAPEWLFLVGLIMIINYILFYAVVFMFQKRNIYEQLKELIEEKTNADEKRKIKEFATNIFGDMT